MLRVSLDEMWDAIEKFGLKRKLVDPNGEFSRGQVEELYGKIIEWEGRSFVGDDDGKATHGA